MKNMNNTNRLSVVIFRASDLKASLRFYRDGLGIPLELGFNEPESDPWYGGHHVELSYREGAYLHFALFPARPPQFPPTTSSEIGFHVSDTLALHQKMVEFGAHVVHVPRDEPWGLTARYADPDGNIVAITSR
jgi:catechol 2,3-dioxygenase-like lactoylglutathione lyase family enzyme